MNIMIRVEYCNFLNLYLTLRVINHIIMISTIFIIYVPLSILSMFMLTLIGQSGQFIFTCINKVVMYESLI